jgi:hypothetical protein
MHLELLEGEHHLDDDGEVASDGLRLGARFCATGFELDGWHHAAITNEWPVNAGLSGHLPIFKTLLSSCGVAAATMLVVPVSRSGRAASGHRHPAWVGCRMWAVVGHLMRCSNRVRFWADAQYLSCLCGITQASPVHCWRQCIVSVDAGAVCDG